MDKAADQDHAGWVPKTGHGVATWALCCWALGLLLACSGALASTTTREPAPEPASVPRQALQDTHMPAVAAAIAAAWSGEAVASTALPAALQEPAQAVYLAVRSDGRRLLQLHRFAQDLPAGATRWDVTQRAIADARRQLAAADLAKVSHLEINLSHSFRRYDYDDAAQRRLLLDQHSHGIPHHFGLRGLQVELDGRRHFHAPTWLLASNRRNTKQLRLDRDAWQVSEATFASARFHTFEADQVLVRLGRRPVEAVLLFRGNRIVDINQVTQASTRTLAEGLRDWLVNNLDERGRLVYEYYPSAGRENPGNNLIRQWMATLALIRWAQDRQDPAMFALAARNIAFNLQRDFHIEHDHQQIDWDRRWPLHEGILGVIEGRDKVKLGAVALAGLALWSHPERARWALEIQTLRNMVDHLWHDSGAFDSFYRGPDIRYDNFYPGEAMLWWATIYAETREPTLLARYKRSFAYYRAWHRQPANRNPAFVPWHLQANYVMWQSLGDDEAGFRAELADFMLETASWLVEQMQQWEAGEWRYPDERGRFYAPDKPWGVPHASSTGVYLEGLIDAWQLARQLGDRKRSETYRIALLRGLRSIQQLQFVDDIDLYYVSRRERVTGGIRTTVFDNRIRCDNVQHPLMAAIKILRLFEAEDYRGAE